MSKRAHGLALVLLIFILAIISTTVFVSMLPHQPYQLNRDARSNAELNAAKEALIGNALTYPPTNSNPSSDDPGRFPCPEKTLNIGQTNEGEADSSCDTSTVALGRLAWKTISAGQFRDGNQSQLWYALSPTFINTAGVINSNTVSPLLTFNGEVNHAIAIVIAPGAALPLAGQNRPVPTSSNPPLVADYLEGENANGDNAFRRGAFSSQFNDQLLAITPDDLFIPLEKRVMRDIQAYLRNYKLIWGVFPFPAAFGDPAKPTTTFKGDANQTGGWLPVADAEISFDVLHSTCQSTNLSNGIVEMGNVGYDKIKKQVVCTINNQNYSSNRDLKMVVKINNLGKGFYKQSLDTKTNNDFTYVPTGIKDNSALSYQLDSQGNGTITFTSSSNINSATYSIFLNDLPTWDNWASSNSFMPAYIAKNHWHHLIFYKVAPGFLPGGNNTCDASNPCISINTKTQLSPSSPAIATTQSNVHAVLISAGRPLTKTKVSTPDNPTQDRSEVKDITHYFNPDSTNHSDYMSDYFDTDNNAKADTGLILDVQSFTFPISTFNDQIQIIE